MSLSDRMRDNVESIMPKIATQVAQRSSNNPPIDLGTAENWLIRKEMVEFFKESISCSFVEQDLSYQKGFTGDPRLIAALADAFNRFFSPRLPVDPSHVVAGPGGAAILDSLLTTICDPGDGMLVLAPFWSGFHFQFSVRPRVKIIPVNAPDEDLFNEKIVENLRASLVGADTKVKGVVLCNPQNPLGQCYTEDALKGICVFCEENDLHLISDEIYALSTYESADLPDPTPFISILSLDFQAMNVSPGRAHAIWSVSKDFGCSGVRLGALVSQHNPAVACGVAMACNTQVSSLTAIAVTALLTNKVRLDSFIDLNRKRLSAAYATVVSFLSLHSIRYIPAYAGIYVWAKLSDRVVSWEHESQLQKILADKQVAVSAGKSYSSREPGWFRVSFAILKDDLKEGLDRVAAGIAAFHQSG